MSKLTILLQVPGTLLILAFVPTNTGKLMALVVLWAATFQRLSKPEGIFVLLVSLFFTVMNAASLKQGIFVFRYPDLLRMPIWELPMWGFYLLHTKRLLEGFPPQGRRGIVWSLVVPYAAAFATIPDANLLLAVTGILLIIALVLFHEPLDLAYTAYMVVLGAAIEYTGVLSGQWYYPDNPTGGVPLWFVTLWGGVGLFLRRLLLPILTHYERLNSERST